MQYVARDNSPQCYIATVRSICNRCGGQRVGFRVTSAIAYFILTTAEIDFYDYAYSACIEFFSFKFQVESVISGRRKIPRCIGERSHGGVNKFAESERLFALKDDTSSAILAGHSCVKTLNKNPNLNKLNLRPPHNYLPRSCSVLSLSLSLSLFSPR